jgi:hypothetical protein
MMLNRTYGLLAIAFLMGLSTLSGCASVEGAVSKLVARAAEPTLPLGIPVDLVTARGLVEFQSKTESLWRPVVRRVDGMIRVRVSGGGAVLRLGDAGAPVGKLWLKHHSQVMVGMSSAGELRVILERGVARLSLFSDSLVGKVLGVKELEDVTARDVILSRVKGQRGALIASSLAQAHLAEWSFEVESAPRMAGVGTMETRDPHGSIAHLNLTALSVAGKVRGDMVETEVEHVFDNPSAARLEGTFRFPMPHGAVLTGLAMEIEGKLMEGELMERKKARSVYNKIVDAMQDPALLEWEKGNIFKLRVFPIEPRQTKRVVLRYLVPLTRAASRWVFSYRAATPAMNGSIGRFKLTLDGVVVKDIKGFKPSGTIVVPVSAVKTPARVQREVRKDGHYTSIRLKPDWIALPTMKPGRRSSPRRLVLVVDTSRSSLESRELAQESIQILLNDLTPADRFVLLASDITVRAHHPEFVTATPNHIKQALSFLEGIESDGASDLQEAFRAAGKQAETGKDKHPTHRTQIVYIGDGTATWGETDDTGLGEVIKSQLGSHSLHAVVLGRRAETDVLRHVAQKSGGWITATRSPLAIRRFSMRLSSGDRLRRISDVKLKAGDKDVLYPKTPGTLFMGDEVVALIHTPAGEKPPVEVVLTGSYGGKKISQRVPITHRVAATHVARRWAHHQLAHMQRKGAKREAIVATSLKYQVMSRHTAFLVLENEEAYKKHKIARRNKKQPAPGKVTGVDLASVGTPRPHLTPDHFQPGDPEIHIPAPRNARSVMVVFPFGETKRARWEPALQRWTVRFLVDKETRDGNYKVRVRITHRSGRVEMLKLNYLVDTLKPSVEIRLRATRWGKGRYRIEARQLITMTELKQAGITPRGTLASMRKRYARMISDARRVDVLLPSGKVLRLVPKKSRTFGRYWKPRTPLTGPVTLKVVATDGAGNQRIFNVTLDPTQPQWTRHE